MNSDLHSCMHRTPNKHSFHLSIAAILWVIFLTLPACLQRWQGRAACRTFVSLTGTQGRDSVICLELPWSADGSSSPPLLFLGQSAYHALQGCFTALDYAFLNFRISGAMGNDLW